MSLLWLDSDEVTGHLVMAIEGYVESLGRQRLRVPSALPHLARVMRQRLTKVQDGSFIDALAEALNDVHMDRVLFTLEETADALGVSVSTVKRLTADGKLQTVKVAGARRVHTDDLRAYTDQLRQDAA